MNAKKHICVAAALLFQNGKIFATKRGDSPYPYVAHKYEFPGGKIEEGESGERAVARELKEELDMQVKVGGLYAKHTFEYPDFIITHDPNDYMPDHTAVSRLVFDASFTATLPNYPTKTGKAARLVPIYYMDTLCGVGFNPTEYVDVSDIINE